MNSVLDYSAVILDNILHCIDFHVLLDWNGTTIYKFWQSNFLRVPVQNNVSFYFALSDLIDHALTDF